jgi:hypothetical protein
MMKNALNLLSNAGLSVPTEMRLFQRTPQLCGISTSFSQKFGREIIGLKKKLKGR